jgi:hypothetical protein
MGDPIKIKIVFWLMLENKVLTWENLRRRGWEGPSICSLCLREEETILHIMVCCPFTLEIWKFLAIEFKFNTVWGGIFVDSVF